MREDQPTGAAVFASPGKVLPLPHAGPPHRQDHLTWAYQTHVTAIYQYVYSRVGNRPDAEDLTAQVFMKAINGMRSDVSVPELRSWLYRVAQTTLADHWREYYAEGTGELDDDVTRPPAPRENPEAAQRVSDGLVYYAEPILKYASAPGAAFRVACDHVNFTALRQRQKMIWCQCASDQAPAR